MNNSVFQVGADAAVPTARGEELKMGVATAACQQV